MTRSSVAAVVYVVGWVIAAAALALVAVAALDGDDPDVVTVPPVRETKLTEAARDAGCELRRPEPGQALNPPVDGGADAAPTPAGFYETSPGSPALVAALRRGVVVIQFREPLDGSQRDLLRSLQEAAPTGTIVAPNATGMRFAVAATAYRHLLGCRHLDARSVDALQLFRGRFVGVGPDS